MTAGRAWRSIGVAALAFLAAGGLAAGQAAAQQQTTERPNIIFIFTDDHASHAISAYGSVINQTPNIDRIAREGMRFDNCFVTNSICAPSRAVILTGKFSHLNGQLTNRESFDGSQQTFPKLLQQAGYQTALIGKWHLKSDPTGFDHWSVLLGQGPYYNPPMDTANGRVQHTGYTTDIITDLSLEWLKNGRDKSKPFMLMTQHKAPHREWAPGPDHLNKYDDVTIPEPPDLFDDYSGRGTAAKEQEMTVANHMNDRDLKLEPPPNLNQEQLRAWNAAYGPKNQAFRRANLSGDELVRWKYQRYIKDYLRAIASVDDNIGRLLKYLDDSGLARNTVVIYNSDQGFYLGDHGWYDKRFMYEQSLRTPLIVRWPGVTAAGSVDRHLVQNLDLAQTFLDLAGVDAPDDMQGRSLVPLLRGRSSGDWRDAIYYHYYEYPAVHMVHRHYGVRTDRYKLIHFYQLNEWELYDLQKDPREMKSVYDDPAYAAVVSGLKKRLQDLRQQYADTEDHEAMTDPHDVKPALALQYDFTRTSRNLVRDVSGNFRHGRLSKTVLVEGRRSIALRMEGDDVVQLTAEKSPDPAHKPLTVGGWCRPYKADGVLIAQGGASQGFSLYLKDAVPHFAVRSGGKLTVARAREPIQVDQWVHLAGTLDADGNLQVMVDGGIVGLAKGELLTAKPADPMSVGADSGSLVGDYTTPQNFVGLLEDVRVYWGTLTETAMRFWIGRISDLRTIPSRP